NRSIARVDFAAHVPDSVDRLGRYFRSPRRLGSRVPPVRAPGRTNRHTSRAQSTRRRVAPGIMAGKRRSEADRTAELESRIAQLKSRMEEKKVKKDPALKFVSKAVKAIDAAAAETRDVPMRQALEAARTTLAACLSLTGTVVPQQ